METIGRALVRLFVDLSGPPCAAFASHALV